MKLKLEEEKITRLGFEIWYAHPGQNCWGIWEGHIFLSIFSNFLVFDKNKQEWTEKEFERLIESISW